MANVNYRNWVEMQGRFLRRRLKLFPLSYLDPFALAKEMKVHVMSLRDIPQIPESVLTRLLIIDRHAWSAGCLPIPNGPVIVVYNPTHALTRQKATIMEELAHVHLKHKGSKLASGDGCLSFRSYNKSEETQAYAVGAAALLPVEVLKKAQEGGTSRELIASERVVSSELVKFRENITGVKLRN